MQKPPYLDKISLVSIWLGMVSTQLLTWVYKVSHLEIPVKYHYLTDITILIPTCKFFETKTDVGYQFHDSPIY